jgi:hypothetical protein
MLNFSRARDRMVDTQIARRGIPNSGGSPSAFSSPSRSPFRYASSLCVIAKGGHAGFDIDPEVTRLGDHLARVVARERQERGEIPEGEIKFRAIGSNRVCRVAAVVDGFSCKLIWHQAET